MRVIIKPGKACGTVSAPASKSMAHRLLICAALSDGVSEIRGVNGCEDVLATLDCMSAMGIKYEKFGSNVKVYGNSGASIGSTPLHARESGSTLRFLIPYAMTTGKTVMFTGEAGLMRRPMSVYSKLAEERGLVFLTDGESITVKGPLRGGEFTIAGNISSQFISGLLFALPLLKNDSRIKILPPIESRSYIDMTIHALSIFGVRAVWEDEYTLVIPGGQKYQPTEVFVEGDYSGAAFMEALNVFGSDVKIEGLNRESLQGDRVYQKHFPALLRGVPTIHIGDCPDLGPVFFAVAAGKNGAVFNGTRRLKIKESDRAEAMASELKKFGTSVSVMEDKVVIYPAVFKAPSEALYGHNDHRIVMALSVLLTVTGGEIIGAEAVKKSYPEFFCDLKKLGIEVEEYED